MLKRAIAIIVLVIVVAMMIATTAFAVTPEVAEDATRFPIKYLIKSIIDFIKLVLGLPSSLVYFD